jgi:hypothetical protein
LNDRLIFRIFRQRNSLVQFEKHAPVNDASAKYQSNGPVRVADMFRQQSPDSILEVNLGRISDFLPKW